MKWNPTAGGYEMTCPACYREFIGRKNKVYCGISCKTKHNNDLLMQRYKVKQRLTVPLLRNIEVLEHEFSSQQSEALEVSMERLSILGFDHKAPKISFRPSKGAAIWYRYGDYAILPAEDKKSITITKLKANG